MFLVQNYKAFTTSKTVTSIDSTTAPLSDITFPSVFVCNINQVSAICPIKSFISRKGLLVFFYLGPNGNFSHLWINFFFHGDFHGYFKLCQCTYFHVGTSEKMAKILYWEFWLKPLKRVCDLDPDASGGTLHLCF